MGGRNASNLPLGGGQPFLKASQQPAFEQRRRLARDESLARTLDSTDDRFGPVASHRVGGEGHSGRICFDLPLDENGHTSCSLWRLSSTVGSNTTTERRNEDSSHGCQQDVRPAHVEHRLVLPSKGSIGQVFVDPGGADCQRDIAESLCCGEQSIDNICWQRCSSYSFRA